MPKGMKYYVHVTVNTPTGERNHEYKTDSLDKVIRHVLEHQPECTSVVICAMPNREINQ